jgi:hypothetical protein
MGSERVTLLLSIVEFLTNSAKIEGGPLKVMAELESTLIYGALWGGRSYALVRLTLDLKRNTNQRMTESVQRCFDFALGCI